MKLFNALLLSVTFSVCAGCSNDSTSSDLARIEGTLIDSRNGNAIAQGTVTLVGANKSVVTGSEGRFTFADLEPGNYRLAIKKQNFGYNLGSEFALSSDQSYKVNTEFIPVMGEYDFVANLFDEKPDTAVVTFFDNLTAAFVFLSGSGDTTNWTLAGDKIEITVNGTTMEGLVDGGMSGTIIQGGQTAGTWRATRK